jgi:hypothetical protein
MTTNVYDVASGLLTSDSRWSIDEGDWIAFVDDTNYDKIVFDNELGLLFAGDLSKIEIWKDWFLSGRTSPIPLDQVDRMSIIGIDMPTGNIAFHSDYLLVSTINSSIEAWYGGTGAPYAKDCWQLNRCARKAVETAKAEDDFSGGNTVFAERESLETNLANSEKVESVLQQMKERGIMINSKGSQEPTLVKDAANDPSNPLAQSLAQKIMSGKAALGAPFPGMDQPWTNEKKAELEKALAPYVRRK